MSDPFDPEKVERHVERKETHIRVEGRIEIEEVFQSVVRASDYDKLLAQNRLLILLAEQLTRDLCYEGGTLAGSVRMRSYIRQELDLVSQCLHHKPTLEWKSLIGSSPSKSPSTAPPASS